ncbi:hypothetical protein [Zunongwangia endophytica]|uniref:Uncharacterized protein n=1 Tax=Zunongwangia endophytica TaxID=1808945 RepID=A0ABV8HCK3_9FLAO|nr:hypothetical protein [Zunongwangia endophytica]MDN3593506.1 hypothetical protein [Zunongwangia endophytica]
MYSYRELCIKKDLREIAMWELFLEEINDELGDLLKLEKGILNDLRLAGNLQGMRREVILCTAGLCKFEQELKKELEYGKNEYGDQHINLYEMHRKRYLRISEKYFLLKKDMLKRVLERKK